MKERVLTFLKDQEGYVSGEEISKNLGVTRTSIWKVINKLKAQGYNIESSTRKGYKLLETPNIITDVEIKSMINTKLLGKDIKYYEVVSSTNEVAKALAREGAKEGTIVIADQQHSGKGRLGRTWESPSQTGIWMSIILRPDIMPDKASQLTLIAGLGMCEAISRVTGLDAKIKWPNDVVVNGRKVCGILTEMSAEMERINHAIIGIGVNVNDNYLPDTLPYATSLKIEGSKEYSRKDIIKSFLEIFESDYMDYKQNVQFEHFIERYKRLCVTLNNKVKIITNIETYVAKAKTIKEDGSLVILTEDGEEKTVFSGEVSVRGLYGYID